MNNCGQRFRSEVAKFRFLNELIKVLSPKVTRRTKDSTDVDNVHSLVSLFLLFIVAADALVQANQVESHVQRWGKKVVGNPENLTQSQLLSSNIDDMTQNFKNIFTS